VIECRRSLRLSIIIANHNYEEFVGAAIASAITVDWPNKEIIVVDDASTDGSRKAIEAFGDRIVAYFRPKSDQLGAHQFGFRQCSGNVIIFLDSDDLLNPEVMREIAKVWRPGVSKVQYRLALIGADGSLLGTAMPQFPLRDDPERLRRAYFRTTAYTTPPGSGNAYARDFVEKAYALAPSAMRWSDDVLLTLAPILGDVVTLKRSLACYRIHGANNEALGSLDAHKFRQRLLDDLEKARLFEKVCQQFFPGIRYGRLEDGLNHLQYRLASRLVEPKLHPFAQDSITMLLRRVLFAAATSSQMPVRDRAILMAWAISCGLLPRRLRTHLVTWRFAPTERPAIVRTLLTALASLRSPDLRNPKWWLGHSPNTVSVRPADRPGSIH
jgi:glycosyltransferase involved in cell wall biosynthesis